MRKTRRSTGRIAEFYVISEAVNETTASRPIVGFDFAKMCDYSVFNAVFDFGMDRFHDNCVEVVLQRGRESEVLLYAFERASVVSK
jgi:hypothetical protein